MSGGAPGSPFPFIVGSGRSGTTLLRAMLDSHPDLAIPPETRFIVPIGRRRSRFEERGGFDVPGFIATLNEYSAFEHLDLDPGGVARALRERPPSDVPDAVRRLFAMYAERRGKPRYANKTPRHVLDMPLLAGMFPEARFIHLLRDGRDVALSFVGADFGPDSVEGVAIRWRRWVGRGVAFGRALGPARYVELRYEDLVADPEGSLRRLCEFVELPFDAAMLRYFERADQVLAGVRRREFHGGVVLPPVPNRRDWRRDMGAADVEAFEVLAGSLLSRLGYERRYGEPRASASIRAWRRAAASRLKRGASAVRKAIVRARWRRNRRRAVSA